MVVAVIVMLLVVTATSHYIVEAIEEAWRLSFSKLSKRIYEVIAGVIILGVLFSLGKCGCTFNEEYSPTGESTMEHYEPR